MQTLYDLVGAHPDDDADKIKKAYRKAAKANHPDHHAGDPEAVARFRRITAAYSILRNPEQRAAYDRTLEVWRDPAHAILDDAASPQGPTSQKRTASPKDGASKNSSRARSFVSSTIASAVTTLMLGVGFVVLARVSGISMEDLFGPTPPEPGKTAAAQPARPASVPHMPIMVPGPAAASAQSKDKAALEATKDRAAAEKTKNTAAAGKTKDTAAAAETRNPAAAAETKDTTAAAETKDTTAAVETRNPAAAAGTKDTTPAVETRNPAAVAGAKDMAAVETRNPAAAAETKATTAAMDTKDTAADEKTEDTAAAVETRNPAAVLETGNGVAGGETKDTAAAIETKDSPSSEVKKQRAAPQEMKADATPEPAGDVTRRDFGVDNRIDRLPATETHHVPFGARRAQRTEPKMRDAAANGGRSQAAARRTPASEVEEATLRPANGSTCAASQSCPGDVPPLFGIGF